MNDIEYKNNNEISILDKVQCYLPKLHVNGTTVGSLKSKSLKKLAEKFNELSIDTLMKIPSELFLECIDLIDTSSISPNHIYIDSEWFWKREMTKNYRNLPRLNQYGFSYKRMFLEKWLSSHIVSSQISIDDLSSLSEYIWSLNLVFSQTIPSFVIDRCHQLHNLTSLSICCVLIKDLDSIKTLATSIVSLKSLTSLSLTNSICIDDDFIRLLINEFEVMKQIEGCHVDICTTLLALDLSKNKISTDGLHMIMDYFLGQGEQSVLVDLNLGCNLIRSEAARTIGRVLKNNCSLIHLDLSINSIGDGGPMLIEGLLHNKTLKVLNAACNRLTSSTFPALMNLLDQNMTLQKLDLSSNNFDIEDISKLKNHIGRRSNIINIDLDN
jgi:hypothetical protein